LVEKVVIMLYIGDIDR